MNPADFEDIGHFLRVKRAMLQKSVRGLCQSPGMDKTPSWVSNAETGKLSYSATQMNIIKTLYKLTPEELEVAEVLAAKSRGYVKIKLHDLTEEQKDIVVLLARRGKELSEDAWAKIRSLIEDDVAGQPTQLKLVG